jgi:hypothetical protein
LAGGFSIEAGRFLAEVDAVERGRAVDRSAAVSAYDTMLAGLYRGARAGGRRVFVTWEVDVPAWRALVRTPRGLASELGGDPGDVPTPLGRYRYRPWEGRRDHYVATMARNYGEPMAQRAAYEAGLGRPDAAREAAAYGASFAPSFGMADLPRLPFDARELVANSLELFRRLRIYAAQRHRETGTTVAKP